jgi:AcrR family transcriptional regulator
MTTSDNDKGQTRGQKTKAALLNGVLDLVEQGLAFSAMSLREVTRQAGVVPTSFYRHFENMDELGLNLVDQTMLNLRKQMRESRANAVPGNGMIEKSLDVYAAYILENRSMFSFIMRERYGGSEALRDAIRREIQFFASELAADLDRLGLFNNLGRRDLENFATLVVDTVANATMTILRYEEISPRMEEDMQDLRQQLMFLFIGALQWRKGGDKADKS